MDTGQFTGYEVTLEKPGIAWIEFNEPEKLNGMSARKKRDLIETVTQAQMDNAVRVVVFIGQGRGFCAGDNLKGKQSKSHWSLPSHMVMTRPSVHTTAYVPSPRHSTLPFDAWTS